MPNIKMSMVLVIMMLMMMVMVMIMVVVVVLTGSINNKEIKYCNNNLHIRFVIINISSIATFLHTGT